MTHEPIEGLDEALNEPITKEIVSSTLSGRCVIVDARSYSLLKKAACRYRDLCKPVDVEALRSFIESVIAYWTTSNECLPSQEDAERLLATITEANTCPSCGGDADNGHDRCVPPNPYNCTRCESPVTPEMAREALDYVDKLLVIWAGFGVINVPIYETIRQLLKERAGV